MNENCRSQIYSFGIITINGATITNRIGDDSITVVGDINMIHHQSIEFSEELTEQGGYVSQELKVILPLGDTDYRGYIDKDVLVCLKYTNGVSKIIGTKENPVRLELKQSGQPVVITLSFKRKSAEFAKVAKSF